MSLRSATESPALAGTVPEFAAHGRTWTHALMHSRPMAFLRGSVVVGLAVRLIVVLCVFRIVAAPTFDHNEFGWEMGWTARSILLGHGFSAPFLPLTGPTALVPPLFPYLLAGVERIFGLYTPASALVILSLNSLLSALTAIPIYFTTRSAFSERAARYAVLLWSVYPYSVYFAADRVWDYALTALLLSLCFWLSRGLHRRGAAAWAGFGALSGVAALSNPSVLTVLAVIAAPQLWRRNQSGRPWVKCAACALLAGLAICAPWTVRNERVFHHPTFIRDGFWLEFWAGNNGDTFESNAPWTHPASNPVEMLHYESMPEPAYMAEKRELALNFARQHPGFVITASARRIVSFWTAFWSFDPRYLQKEPTEIPDMFFCTAMSLLAFRGLVRWWLRDRAAALPYALALAVFPVAYYLTHCSPDYRQPIEPLMVALAAIGLAGMPQRDILAAELAEDEPEYLIEEQEPVAAGV